MQITKPEFTLSPLSGEFGSLDNLNSLYNSVSPGITASIKYNSVLGKGLRDASGDLYDLVIVDSSMYLKYGPTSWAQWCVSKNTLG